jgi:signal transduction histidine kinase
LIAVIFIPGSVARRAKSGKKPHRYNPHVRNKSPSIWREKRGDWVGYGVFALTVIAGYVQYLTGARADAGSIAILIALGGIYCVLGIAWFTVCHPDYTPRQPPWPYLLVQLALAMLIVYLGMRWARGDGSLALIALPLVSHALILLTISAGLVYAGLLVAAFGGTLLAYGVAPAQIPANLTGIVPGVAFVTFFSVLAVNAIKARAQVEQLARELRAANVRLAEYAAQVEELATARERNRLAREVHDSLGHYLTVANVQLESARATLDSDPAKSRAAIETAQTLTRDGLTEVRRSVAALRAGPLATRTLREAVAKLADESRASGLAVEFSAPAELPALTPQCELVLYRAAQEGLTNIRKHSTAARAWLTLTQTANLLELRVRDDGQPRTTSNSDSADSTGTGLLGLRERARLVGGDAQTGPNLEAGGGFTLCVSVPASA